MAIHTALILSCICILPCTSYIKPGIQQHYRPEHQKEFLTATILHKTGLFQSAPPHQLHQAGFAYKGQQALITLNEKGKIMKYELPVKFQELPLPVQYYLKHTPAYSHNTPMVKVIGMGGICYYKISLPHHTLILNTAGKLL